MLKIKQKISLRFSFLLFLLYLGFTGNAQDVYKTPSGKKYHLETCKTVKNVSQKITLQQAAEKGLEPCKVCKPAALPVPQNVTNKAKGEGKTVQCQGKTKRGTRCRHMTGIADGYCFQHRPK